MALDGPVTPGAFDFIHVVAGVGQQQLRPPWPFDSDTDERGGSGSGGRCRVVLLPYYRFVGEASAAAPQVGCSTPWLRKLASASSSFVAVVFRDRSLLLLVALILAQQAATLQVPKNRPQPVRPLWVSARLRHQHFVPAWSVDGKVVVVAVAFLAAVNAAVTVAAAAASIAPHRRETGGGVGTSRPGKNARVFSVVKHIFMAVDADEEVPLW